MGLKGFSFGDDFTPQEHLAMTEDLFGYHKVRRGMLLSFSESKEVKVAALDCLKQGRWHPTAEPQQEKQSCNTESVPW